ncbi:hypothetical protein ART_1113 [Arthrobacter sp. PAMC 25486]|uniref:putative protein N(5)-glutamine methyltransferase n=1 Tax=Arthrobacter sp. PAMC 25486 TaxID=1494608 RepID=UPI0005364114|nr:putative protein N(5)-glutamine methyltransferase [Arthrobacter sp. PAMC 25486]AIY00712.1 hypothetical protein ART_1113 [Arthrobacter sp. PAMC 25486]
MEQSTALTAGQLIVALRLAGCVHAEEEAAILLEAARPTAGSAEDAVACPGTAAAAGPGDRLAQMLEQRRQGIPLEHIVGWAEFCGRRVAVVPGVFVPRKRSEFLVEQALAVLAHSVRADTDTDAVAAPLRPVIVDLCCGTGALGAAIACALPECELHAADIDATAVACAAGNIAPFGGRAHCGDLFAALPKHLRGRIDVIVANAPYVPAAAIAFMPQEARLHEPDIALNGGADGLALHRRIAEQAGAWLRPGGTVLLECSEKQASRSAAILAGHGFVTGTAVSEALDGVVVTAH